MAFDFKIKDDEERSHKIYFHMLIDAQGDLCVFADSKLAVVIYKETGRISTDWDQVQDGTKGAGRLKINQELYQTQGNGGNGGIIK